MKICKTKICGMHATEFEQTPKKQTNDFVATKPQNFTSTWWQMEYAACVPQNLNKLTKNRQMILRQRCRKISGARGGKTELQWNWESGI